MSAGVEYSCRPREKTYFFWAGEEEIHLGKYVISCKNKFKPDNNVFFFRPPVQTIDLTLSFFVRTHEVFGKAQEFCISETVVTYVTKGEVDLSCQIGLNPLQLKANPGGINQHIIHISVSSAQIIIFLRV